MKVLFAGTPDFSVPALRALNEAHEVVGVFTQPDAKVGRGKKLTPPIIKVVANELNIPVFQPSELHSQKDVIKSLNVDVMVVVAYGMLLPQSILSLPRLGCLNIHASILPRWRGAAPIHRAIEAGDTQSGVSIMQMELGLDTGPVYQTLTTPITKTDTTPSLHDRLAELGAQGICNTLEQLANNPDLTPIAQNDDDANYAKKITKREAELDWTQSATLLDQRIRAFVPWPVCQTHHVDTRIRVSQASISSDNNANSRANHKPGTITQVDEHGIHVHCGSGTLILQTLQRDGSRALTASEFLNGYPLIAGDSFT